MKKAQLEAGFFRIANTLFEAVYSREFTFRETKILLCVIRCSYGWNRKETRPEVTKASLGLMTGIHRSHASTALATLCTKRVLFLSNSQYSINTDLAQWDAQTIGMSYQDATTEDPNPPKKVCRIGTKLRENRVPNQHTKCAESALNVCQIGTNDPSTMPTDTGSNDPPKDNERQERQVLPLSPNFSDSPKVTGSSGDSGPDSGPLHWLPEAQRKSAHGTAHRILLQTTPGGFSASVWRKFNALLSVPPPPSVDGKTWASILVGHIKAGVEHVQHVRARGPTDMRRVPLVALTHASDLLGDSILTINQNQKGA